MEGLKSSFLQTTLPYRFRDPPPKPTPKPYRFGSKCSAVVRPDPWTLSDGNGGVARPKPRSERPKKPLSDDNVRRIIKSKARYLSELRRNQGSRVQTPGWIRRTPEQMVRYLQDNRNGHIYGKHVVAAVHKVRCLAPRPEGSYDMREVMASFVTKLTFREMCIVLKEQRGWRQARDFFAWMKLQLCYRPSVIVYTILLRTYGQVGRIKHAEETFLEMLEAGCEPDEVACGTMLCAYAKWGHHKAMLSFYSVVQERGIILSVAVFNFMLSSLHKKSLHKDSIQIWNHMIDKGIIPNHFTCTIVISSMVKEGANEEAFRTFNEMRNYGFVPEEVTYSLLISLCSKNSDQDKALRLYDDMRSRGIIPSNFTCASLLAMHCKNEDYSKALSLFREMESNKIAADEVIYGLFIKIYGKLGLHNDAEKTFEEVQKLGLLTDEKTYVTMAQVHLNSGNVEKALHVMELKKSRNIWFSQYAYMVLLRCYVMKGDVGSAEVTFQALTKTGFPSARTCNDMLNLYIKLNLTEKAKKFIIYLRKYQVEFNEELCKTVLKIYYEEGMLRDAEQLIEEMSRNESFTNSKFMQTISMATGSRRLVEAKNASDVADQPDAVAFELMLTLYLSNSDGDKAEEIVKYLLETTNGLSVASQLITKFVREGAISRAERLYEQLIKLGHKPEDAAGALLISFYGKQKRLNQAQEVFSALLDSAQSGRPLYTAMFDAYAKCNKAEEAYWLYKEVTKKGHYVGPVAISMLVNMLISDGKYQDAKNVIQNCLHEDLELDTVAFNTFIKAMLEAGKLHFAVSIYEYMLHLGVAPSIQTYSTMISVYGRDGNLDKAVEMFNMAPHVGISLDEKAYANMINIYGKAGKNDEAFFLFKKMQSEGIKPGKVSYDIMLKVSANGGLYEEAEELFQAMLRDGYSPDSISYLALIRAYTLSSKYSEAEETLISMQKKGILPSRAHFNHLLAAFVKAGLIEEAERVYFKLLPVAGFNHDLACLHSMLRAYLEYGHVGKGLSFYERVRGFVKPNKFVFSAAVHFYKAAGKETEAEGVLNSMAKLGLSYMENLEVGSKLGLPEPELRKLDEANSWSSLK